MKRFFCLLLMFFVQLSLHAGQDRHDIETAYFHAAQDKHTLESVQAKTFTPYRGQLRLGFTAGETWIRIRLQASPNKSATDSASPLVLKVEPYSLDRLTFFQHKEGTWSQQLGGELQFQKRNFCIELQHCFVFDASHADKEFAYLKVETTAVRIIRTDVVTADEALTWGWVINCVCGSNLSIEVSAAARPTWWQNARSSKPDPVVRPVHQGRRPLSIPS